MSQQVMLAVLFAVVAGCTVEAKGGREGVDAGRLPGSDGGAGGADASASAVDASSTPTADAADEGDCPRARVVTSGADLRIREEPNTTSEILGGLPNGAIVPVLDRVQGEEVSGNSEWFQIDDQGTVGFISGAFSECTTDAATNAAPPAPYDVPTDSVG